MLTERSFDAGEVTINFAEGPANGPPLVLLHGGTDRWASFESVIPALKEEWHIYALDFRGHGKSVGFREHIEFHNTHQTSSPFSRAKLASPQLSWGTLWGPTHLC